MTQAPQEIIDAARAAQTRFHVPASVSLAQWAIESGWGAHAPGLNPFGMKPRAGRNDPQQMLMTTEWSKARGYYRVPQPFRTFVSTADAFLAHAELIATAPVYHEAMAALPVLDAFVSRLAAHYATDPVYAHKVLALIAAQGWDKLDG